MFTFCSCLALPCCVTELTNASLYVFFTDSVRPYRVVMLAYILTLAERLPEDLVKAIFNVDFLSRLDLDLDGKLQASVWQ